MPADINWGVWQLLYAHFGAGCAGGGGGGVAGARLGYEVA